MNATATVATGIINNNIFHVIPLDIISHHILGDFCTGRTISTFAIVIEGYFSLSLSLSLCNNNNNNRNNNKKKKFSTKYICNDDESTTQSNNEKVLLLHDTLIKRYDRLIQITKEQSLGLSFTESSSSYSVENDNNTTEEEGEESSLSELQCVLEFIRYNIKSTLGCQQKKDEVLNNEYSTSSVRYQLDCIKERIDHVSKWCALIDYFELGLIPTSTSVTATNTGTSTATATSCSSSSSSTNTDLDNTNCYFPIIVWVGSIDVSFGKIDNAMITCNNRYTVWHPSSLWYWYNDYELYEYKLVIPYNSAHIETNIINHPYGTLSVSSTSRTVSSSSNKIKYSESVLRSIVYTLNKINTTSGRFSLVPRQYSYEQDMAPICFTRRHIPTTTTTTTTTTTNISTSSDPYLTLSADDDNDNDDNDDDDASTKHDDDNCLSLYWDHTTSEMTTGWDECIEQLPTNAIRIMNRLQHLQPHPYNIYSTKKPLPHTNASEEGDDDDYDNDDDDDSQE